ncbi:hypothetical protein FNF27_05886 [Cafeteria roenbergensis]|uniref:Uncharacterized protein n=1 Tax=Cafeteria roenbergensis TaxID=33653 RepID=A0A5A8E4F9_CAFRO|nr:hypothetical protein FNF27_05886 [Cafeteria roenbergensis]
MILRRPDPRSNLAGETPLFALFKRAIQLGRLPPVSDAASVLREAQAVAETASLGGDVGVAARAQEAALAHMVAGLPSSRRPRLVHPVAMYDAARYKSLRGREPNPAVGPLRRLFDTYARLFSAGAQLASMGKDALTYDMRAYARKTMSRGELLFLLRDIEVVPQLASRTEVEWVFDRRTHPVKMPHTSIRARPGAGLRAVAELAAGKPAAGEAEEDDVDAAGGGAASPHGPIAGMDPSAAAAAIDAAVSRDPIVEELGWTLDDATVETQLRQGDLDFRRFCRILVRVALFAMSKPSIALSGLGMPSHARLPSGRARLARPPGDDAIPLPREEDDLLLLPQPSDPIDPVTTRAAPQARQALAALGLTPALAARRATASPAAKLRRFLRHTRLVSPSHVSNILNTVARETDDLLNAPGPPPSDMDRASYLPQQSGAVVDAKRAVAALHARRTRLANARGALLPDGEGRLVDSQWRGGASASSVGAIAVTLSRQVPPPTSGTGASAPGPSLASLPAGHRTLPGLAGARGSAPLGAAAEAGVLAEVVDRDRPGRAAALCHPQVEADTSSSDDDDGFADVDPEQRFDGQVSMSGSASHRAWGGLGGPYPERRRRRRGRGGGRLDSDHFDAEEEEAEAAAEAAAAEAAGHRQSGRASGAAGASSKRRSSGRRADTGSRGVSFAGAGGASAGAFGPQGGGVGVAGPPPDPITAAAEALVAGAEMGVVRSAVATRGFAAQGEGVGRSMRRATRGRVRGAVRPAMPGSTPLEGADDDSGDDAGSAAFAGGVAGRDGGGLLGAVSRVGADRVGGGGGGETASGTPAAARAAAEEALMATGAVSRVFKAMPVTGGGGVAGSVAASPVRVSTSGRRKGPGRGGGAGTTASASALPPLGRRTAAGSAAAAAGGPAGARGRAGAGAGGMRGSRSLATLPGGPTGGMGAARGHAAWERVGAASRPSSPGSERRGGHSFQRSRRNSPPKMTTAGLTSAGYTEAALGTRLGTGAVGSVASLISAGASVDSGGRSPGAVGAHSAVPGSRSGRQAVQSAFHVGSTLVAAPLAGAASAETAVTLTAGQAENALVLCGLWDVAAVSRTHDAPVGDGLGNKASVPRLGEWRSSALDGAVAAAETEARRQRTRAMRSMGVRVASPSSQVVAEGFAADSVSSCDVDGSDRASVAQLPDGELAAREGEVAALARSGPRVPTEEEAAVLRARSRQRRRSGGALGATAGSTGAGAFAGTEADTVRGAASGGWQRVLLSSDAASDTVMTRAWREQAAGRLLGGGRGGGGGGGGRGTSGHRGGRGVDAQSGTGAGMGSSARLGQSKASRASAPPSVSALTGALPLGPEHASRLSYDARLLGLLTAVSQDPNAKRWTYYAPAVGETFMDFGRVLVGKRYGFRIEVRNVSGDTLRVHAAKRGLPGLKLRYRARPAAAGMTILLDMQLQARQPLEAIGHVVVTATAGTREERLVCPCYVRAVEPGSVAARLADLPPAQGVVPLGVDGRADGAGEDSSSDGGAALDALGTAMPDSPGGGGGGFRPQ